MMTAKAMKMTLKTKKRVIASTFGGLALLLFPLTGVWVVCAAIAGAQYPLIKTSRDKEEELQEKIDVMLDKTRKT